jgi:hypothetical protein
VELRSAAKIVTNFAAVVAVYHSIIFDCWKSPGELFDICVRRIRGIFIGEIQLVKIVTKSSDQIYAVEMTIFFTLHKQ